MIVLGLDSREGGLWIFTEHAHVGGDPFVSCHLGGGEGGGGSDPGLTEVPNNIDEQPHKDVKPANTNNPICVFHRDARGLKIRFCK